MKPFKKSVWPCSKNLSLRSLITLLLGTFMLAIVFIYSTTGFQRLKRTTLQELDARLRMATDMAQQAAPDNYHDRIDGPQSVSDADYLKIVNTYDDLCQRNGLEYVWSLLVDHGTIYFTSGTSQNKITHDTHAAFFQPHSSPQSFASTFETMTPQFTEISDRWGQIRCALVPAIDSHGRKYLFGAAIRLDAIQALLQKQALEYGIIGCVICLLGGLLCFLLGSRLARPIQNLLDSTLRIADGHLDERVCVHGVRELQTLARSFNEMTEALQERTDQLRDREENLRITLNSIGDAVLISDTNSRVAGMNPAAEALTGWTAKEAKGHPFDKVFRIINAATRKPAINPVGTVLKKGITVGLANHTALIAKDGTEYQIADSAAPIRAKDGTISGAVLVFRDVTQEYEMRARLENERLFSKNIIQSLPGLFFIIEQGNNHLIHHNDNWHLVTGYSSEEIKTIDGNKLVSDPEKLMQKFQEVYESGAATLENFIRTKNGELIPYFFTGRRVHIDGKTYIVGTGMDISARKKAQQEREELELQLRQSQKMEAVGQLVGGIAHDFNNLLQVILGYTQIIQEKMEKTNPFADHIHEILNAGIHARELVRQLLTFSRQQVIEPEALDLNKEIAGLQKMLRRLIGEHISFQFIIEEIPSIIFMDRSQIQQIMMNLCANARDAMPDGGCLTIETKHIRIDRDGSQDHAWAAHGDYVCLSITDTGCGIDNETRQRIFEPFFTTKKLGQGTGLGLSTVYGILKQNNGHIDVSSEPGNGTVFKLYLRLYQAELPRTTAPGPLPAPICNPNNQTILVTEDNPMILKQTIEILSEAGYNILTAENGEEAVQVFGKHRNEINLIMMDVIMPRMCGKEAMQKILEIKPVPCLFISGYSRNAIYTDFIKEKGLHLLIKPYTQSDLLNKTRQILASESSNDTPTPKANHEPC